MNNIVVLYKLEDGSIFCKQLNEEGIEYMKTHDEDNDGMWEEGGTIALDELEEILDRQI